LPAEGEKSEQRVRGKGVWEEEVMGSSGGGGKTRYWHGTFIGPEGQVPREKKKETFQDQTEMEELEISFASLKEKVR